jgi:hypothetical protein
VDSKPPPRNALKPFILLAALFIPVQDQKLRTLSATVSSEALSVAITEEIWTPVYFEGGKYNNITVRKLIEDSVNTAMIRLVGITSQLLPVPSMALGSF